MLTHKNFIRNDPCRELHPETTPYRQFFFLCPHRIQESADHRLSWVRHSSFKKKGRIYMKAKKARTIKKTLQITVLCLFAAAFLLPKGSQSYLMTGIAAAGVLVSLAILIIPPLASGLRKLRIPAGRAMDTGNGNSDLETILIRQISYQITDTLQSAFRKLPGSLQNPCVFPTCWMAMRSAYLPGTPVIITLRKCLWMSTETCIFRC